MMMQGLSGRALALPLVAAGLVYAAPSASAAINLELRPSFQIANVGDTVSFGLYAVADGGVPQDLAAVQVVLGWNPTYLQMMSNSKAGAVTLLTSAFTSPDPYGLNESILPQDGNALYVGFAGLGAPVTATPAGVLLTTLRFEALMQVAFTPVDLHVSGGDPLGFTTVFDGAVPNLSVTGSLSGGGVQIVPGPGALGTLGVGLAGVCLRRRRR
jgi:hypothetical protein